MTHAGTGVDRLLVVAPNWLGDAVMALPAIRDLRAHLPGARVGVAARRGLAQLFEMVPGVAEIVTLQSRGGWRALADAAADARALERGQWDAALLLPNSFHAAWMVHRAGVRERWGYKADWRARWLTRAIDRPRAARLHQAEYYRALVASLGAERGPLDAAIDVPGAAREQAAAMLRRAGWDGRSPLVGLAPGAAYGRAKQWPPARAGALAARLSAAGVTPVVVGAAADRATAAAVARMGGGRVVDLAGRTDLLSLAGVLRHCGAFVSNDSGAMHLAAAVGVAVVAIFGPTREWATSPLPRAGGAAPIVLTGSAWCRPCMLRNCPLDHRCMTSIEVPAVLAAVEGLLGCEKGAA